MKTASTLFQLPITNNDYMVVRMNKTGKYEYENLGTFLQGKQLNLTVNSVNLSNFLAKGQPETYSDRPASTDVVSNEYGPVIRRNFRGTVEIPQDQLRSIKRNGRPVGPYSVMYAKNLSPGLFLLAGEVTEQSDYKAVFVSDTGRLRIGKQLAYSLFTGKKWRQGTVMSNGTYTVSRGGSNGNTLLVRVS
jgi:hypothetical protein